MFSFIFIITIFAYLIVTIYLILESFSLGGEARIKPFSIFWISRQKISKLQTAVEVIFGALLICALAICGIARICEEIGIVTFYYHYVSTFAIPLLINAYFIFISFVLLEELLSAFFDDIVTENEEIIDRARSILKLALTFCAFNWIFTITLHAIYVLYPDIFNLPVEPNYLLLALLSVLVIFQAIAEGYFASSIAQAIIRTSLETLEELRRFVSEKGFISSRMLRNPGIYFDIIQKITNKDCVRLLGRVANIKDYIIFHDSGELVGFSPSTLAKYILKDCNDFVCSFRKLLNALEMMGLNNLNIMRAIFENVVIALRSINRQQKK